MIVEFFGVPGSGKTTTLKRLVRESSLKSQEIHIKGRIEVMLYLLLFVCIHPIKAIYWFYLLYQHSHGLFGYKRSLLLRSIALVMKASVCDEEDRVTYIDEGLLQRSLSLFEGYMTPADVVRIYRYAIRPDVVLIFLEGTFSRYEDRHGQNTSPRMKKGKDYFISWKQQTEENVHRFFEYIKTTDMFYCVGSRAPHGYTDIETYIKEKFFENK